MIRWPDRYAPGQAPVHVRNELLIEAPAEIVWAWLVQAPAWPTWYPNSHDVRIRGGSSGQLEPDTCFRWRTFGVSIRSTVLEFVPPERIAWNAFGIGVEAYHAWLLTPIPGGTHVLTEETQHGWAARLVHLLLPGRMSRFHQLWLERLSKMARGGPPSPGGVRPSVPENSLR